jgi:hypothetical protein
VFSTFNPKDANVELNIFNLIDSTSRTSGMKQMKEESDKSNQDL